MQPRTSLSELASEVPTPPEGINFSTALIAHTDPVVLNSAINKTTIDSFGAYLEADGMPKVVARIAEHVDFLQSAIHEHDSNRVLAATEAQHIQNNIASRFYNDGAAPSAAELDALLKAPAAGPDEHIQSLTRNIEDSEEKLESITARTESGTKKVDALSANNTLANEVSAELTKLARPVKWLAAITIAASLGGAAAAAEYYLVDKAQEEVMAQPHSHHVMNSTVTAENAAVAGGLAALASGFLTSFVMSGEVITARVAHRQARRKIAKN